MVEFVSSNIDRMAFDVVVVVVVVVFDVFNVVVSLLPLLLLIMSSTILALVGSGVIRVSKYLESIRCASPYI